MNTMYKKVLSLGVALVLIFSIALNAQAGSVKSEGNLTASINSDFVNANANSPVGVRGQIGVKIASFAVSASYKNIMMNKIILKNSANSAFALGKDFQNLRLMNNGAQIAPTIGVLSQTASAVYTIYPGASINIPAGGKYIVDVYADSLTNAVNINRSYSAVLLDSVWGVNTSNGSKVVWGTKSSRSKEIDIKGQAIYVAEKGSLSAIISPEAPVGGNRVMNVAGASLGLFNLSAGPEEDIYLTKIVFTDAISGVSTTTSAGSIVNLKLFKDGVQYSRTVSLIKKDNGVDAVAVFDGINLIIPKNQSIKLYLSGDINDYPNAVSGSTHQFKIASGADITAVGLVSGQIINAGNGLDIGGAFTIYRSSLLVLNQMQDGVGYGSLNEQIGKYLFYNYSPGNYQITISDIKLLVSTTINNSSAPVKYIRLYKNYISEDSKIAEKQFANGNDFSGILSWDTFTSFDITPNQSMNIIVTADTVDAAQTNSITTRIDRGVIWSDGSLFGLDHLSYNPIAGAVITY